MNELERIERELGEISDYLDATVPEIERRRVRQRELWQQARDLGATSEVIGKMSRVAGVTVRRQTEGAKR